MRASVWRRVGATCVDYGFVAAWGLALAALAVGVGAHVRFSALSPGAGQLLGIATMTAPATVAIALAEARGGTPGKRLLGLRLETVREEPVRPGTALLRTLAKVALPWELAHTGVWQLTTGGGGALAAGATAAAYLVLGVAAVGVVRGRPWYDHLCGTLVVRRDRSPSPAQPRSGDSVAQGER